ncbi:MAG TPA: hypothetical protein VFF65_08610 [Phycisphaerales bacterium]|nr:hypothetical protein [Phycisphaerales bacterium]
MSGIATNLLRSLLTSHAPAAGQASTVSTVGGLNFANLLSAARDGAITSDRPVDVAPEAAGKFTPDQLQRLAVAADHAEAAGMSSALILIDGQAAKVDVLSREVTAVLDPRTAAVTEIDGVLAAPPSSLNAELCGDAGADTAATAAGVLERQLLARLGGSSHAGTRVSPAR